MAWTTPTVRATGDLITATIWNADIVNNMKWIGGADSRGTSFPGSPVDGQIYHYVADATLGVVWRFKYNAGSASSFKWEADGEQVPLVQEVDSTETTSTTTYTDLATVGPSVTVPLAGDYSITISAAIVPNTSVGTMQVSYSVGGTAASDNDSIYAVGYTGEARNHTRTRRKNGLSASDLIRMKYKCVGTPGPATVQFRRLEVRPRRVG